MRWTTATPKKVGYYWLRIGGRAGDAQVVRVVNRKGTLHILYPGLDGSEPMAERQTAGLACWWAGPVEVPTEHGRCDACGSPNRADGSCSREQCCNSD